jgi:GT2 family glycosyltransferase
MIDSRVSIITINYNGISDTIECINSLKRINYTNYEIFVVDNHSKNNEAYRLKKEFGDYIRLIKSNKNVGFSGGNNLAIRQVIKEKKSQYILLINNDTVIKENALNLLVKKASSNSKYGSISPKILQYYHKDKVDSLGINYYKCGINTSINNDLNKDMEPIGNITTAMGACVLYNVEALKKISYKSEVFDEEFFLYSEEVDLGFRIIHSGFIPVYEENAIVYHKGGSTSGGSTSDLSRFYQNRNNLLTIYKNYSVYNLVIYIIPIFIIQIGTFCLYIKRKKLKLIMRAYVSFIRLLSVESKKRRFIVKNSEISSREFRYYLNKQIFPLRFIIDIIKK